MKKENVITIVGRKEYNYYEIQHIKKFPCSMLFTSKDEVLNEEGFERPSLYLTISSTIIQTVFIFM